jgi:hypothetical protein
MNLHKIVTYSADTKNNHRHTSIGESLMKSWPRLIAFWLISLFFLFAPFNLIRASSDDPTTTTKGQK